MDSEIATTLAAENEASPQGEAAARDVQKYLIITINDKQYAISSDLIGEVAVLDQVYPLPLLPAYFRGIINRYSTPYALIDLNLLIQNIPSETNKIVVFKEVVDNIAFLIDDVVDIVDVPNKKVLRIAQENSDGDGTGIVEASFPWLGTNVLILNVNEILNRLKADQNR